MNINNERSMNKEVMSLSQNPTFVEATVFNTSVCDAAQVPSAPFEMPVAAIPIEAYAPQATIVCASSDETPLNVRAFVNEVGARGFLTVNQWPAGLQDTFVQQLQRIPMRFFLCDNSGSMYVSDGHSLCAETKSKFLQSTRWQELTEALRFHANLAHASGAPTEFRMLHGDPPVTVGWSDEEESDRLNTLMTVLDKSPGGAGTPLCRHIREIIDKIRPMEAQLRAAGQKACVIIATDGDATDGHIAWAMQPLRELPVRVVVRLCTDEDRIVKYWNDISSELDLDMDVLDDLRGEATKVTKINSWLTYAEAMHRLREFGVFVKEIDLVDTNKLSFSQMRKFCSIIFGGTADIYAHPERDLPAFLAAVHESNKLVGKVFDPVTLRHKHWIDEYKLRAAANDGSCVVM